MDELGALDADLLAPPACSNTGVPKPPGVAVSAISLSGLRAGETISSATRCSAVTVGMNAVASGTRRGTESALMDPSSSAPAIRYTLSRWRAIAGLSLGLFRRRA